MLPGEGNNFLCNRFLYSSRRQNHSLYLVMGLHVSIVIVINAGFCGPTIVDPDDPHFIRASRLRTLLWGYMYCYLLHLGFMLVFASIVIICTMRLRRIHFYDRCRRP
ncbi:unnamed protein product [Prorocentrum cordatum]|uniref:Protein S-acyltransferase n=1 Tax=Prorocentrum cordatum TaxID=2364126 RepID=A0ABN9SU97_9DINO|nr:unnamed protein product [Polarella glacialis]